MFNTGEFKVPSMTVRELRDALSARLKYDKELADLGVNSGDGLIIQDKEGDEVYVILEAAE